MPGPLLTVSGLSRLPIGTVHGKGRRTAQTLTIIVTVPIIVFDRASDGLSRRAKLKTRP